MDETAIKAIQLYFLTIFQRYEDTSEIFELIFNQVISFSFEHNLIKQACHELREEFTIDLVAGDVPFEAVPSVYKNMDFLSRMIARIENGTQN